MFVQYFDGSVEGIRWWICCSCQPGADIIQPSEGQEGSLFGSRWGIVANRVECHTATDLAEIQKLVREECVISDVICTASAPAPFRRNSQINDPVIHQCEKVPFVQGCLTVIVLLLSSDTLGPACGTKDLTRGCGGSTVLTQSLSPCRLSPSNIWTQGKLIFGQLSLSNSPKLKLKLWLTYMFFLVFLFSFWCSCTLSSSSPLIPLHVTAASTNHRYWWQQLINSLLVLVTIVKSIFH